MKGTAKMSPFERLLALKRVITRAAKSAAEDAREGECNSASACLYWVPRARSAVSESDFGRLWSILARVPRLAEFFDVEQCSVVDVLALKEFLSFLCSGRG